MSHIFLSDVVNSALIANPTDSRALDNVRMAMEYLSPHEVKLRGDGGWKGDPDFLLYLVDKSPKRLPQLIGPRTIHHSLVDTLLQVDHKPTATIADRVAGHKALSRKGIDYVLDNGTHKALERLVAYHFDALTADDLRRASFKSADRSGKLICPTGPRRRDWDGPRFPDEKWRDFLEAQLEALDLLPQDALEGPDWSVAYSLLGAACAGLDVPAELAVKASEHCFGGEPLVPDLTLLQMVRYHAWEVDVMRSLVLLDPDLPERLRAAPTAVQKHFVSIYPLWEVLAMCSDPDAVVRSGSFYLHGSAGELTPELATKLPVSTLQHGGYNLSSSVLEAICARLGDDGARWSAFTGLADNWSGTLGELLDTVDSV